MDGRKEVQPAFFQGLIYNIFLHVKRYALLHPISRLCEVDDSRPKAPYGYPGSIS